MMDNYLNLLTNNNKRDETLNNIYITIDKCLNNFCKDVETDINESQVVSTLVSAALNIEEIKQGKYNYENNNDDYENYC
jgi:hypothetical protein